MPQGHRRLVAPALALALTLASGAATPPAATSTTVYLAQRQVLPLLSQPQPGSPTSGTIGSGDALTEITRLGEWVQVRASNGADGWIRSINLTTEAPTLPSQLEVENAQLVQQVTTLDAQLRAFQAESAQLRTRLDAVEAELAVHSRAMPLTPAGVYGLVRRLAVEPTTWISCAALLLALALAFRRGVAHRDESIRRRFGGLDL